MSQGEGEDSIFTLKEKQIVSPGTWKLITTIQRGENGIPISRVCETYAVTRNGNLCTSRIEGYGTDYARETLSTPGTVFFRRRTEPPPYSIHSTASWPRESVMTVLPARTGLRAESKVARF